MGRGIEERTVALVGNPNVGKSTLFNALTGLHQHTGNWPGKTVSVAQGTLRRGGKIYRMVDLPGTYALDGKSEDEQIAGSYIRSGEADDTVVVCDGSALERNLILALQVRAVTGRMIVCVNLMDEAAAQGIAVDRRRLEVELGVPVILMSAGRKQGIEELLTLLGQDREESELRTCENPVWEAERIAAECVSYLPANQGWRLHLDRLLVSRRHGIGIAMGLLFGIVWLTVWGANYPSMLLQKLFDWGYLWLSRLLSGAPDILRGVLADGIYATAGRIMSVMLPPMAIFFPLFTLLEDIGYLPRLAFLLDHGMRRCGGCGKQALTLCMGLGCNAVGVTGCRILESPRERLAAILTNAMVPCNGRFPTLIIVGSLFFPEAGSALLVSACVALGAGGAMAVSGVLSKTALRSHVSAFLMEIPPLRRPRLGQILLRSLLDKTLRVAARALAVAIPAGGILWLFANTPVMDGIIAVLSFPGRLLGMDGLILFAFFACLPANELFLPVILMAASGSGVIGGDAVSAQLLSDLGWTGETAVCVMLFTLFHWPCATTLQTIYRETGSIKNTAAAFFLPTAVGCILCFLVHVLLGKYLGG